MKANSVGATIERQLRSRFRSLSYWIAAVVPVLLISVLLHQTAKATASPATVMFLAILSALWIGGSSCVREIVDERKLVQRDPHLGLLAYGLSKIIHASLLAAGQSLILTFFLLLSDVIGLPVFQLWMILFLTTVSGSMLAMILSALCDEAATALAWFPLLLVPQVVFGGFLFPYGATQPFSFDQATSEITVMPESLIRQDVRNRVLRIAGALCVSRWALESYAAKVFEQELGEADNLQEAVRVAFFMPLTLVDLPISERLTQYLAARASGEQTTAPELDAGSGRYLSLLTLFAAGQAALLVLILPLRDPRRA